jgi:signal transduction histidine kinase
MSEQELLQEVGQARHKLTSLLARLVHMKETPGSAESRSILAGLLETLEAMQAHCERMHEILVRTGRTEVQRDRLRSLASEIIIEEERLRQTLAADLQSGLGQDIALAKLELARLRSSSNVELQAELRWIEDLVERADVALRSVTYQLCPPSLHDLGLVPALEWLAEDFTHRYGLDVRIENAGIPALDEGRMPVILFRAVRALLINAVRHSGGTEVLVWLGPEDGALRISVSDNGAGFDSTRVDFEGLGLFGIREQMRHVSGSMLIASAAGHGTTVTLLAPLLVEKR